MRIADWNLAWDFDAVPWRETKELGVFWLPLHLAEDEPVAGPESKDAERAARGGRRGGGTVLVRMDPGCGYPAHRHLSAEEVLVLQGGYRDQLGTHTAGDFVRYPAESAHAPVALGERGRAPSLENPPCVLFTSVPGGIELLGRSAD